MSPGYLLCTNVIFKKKISKFRQLRRKYQILKFHFFAVDDVEAVRE